MPQPDFTPPERALIHRIDDARAPLYVYELAYLVPSALLVLVGFVYDAHGAFAAAFAVIATFRAYDLHHQRDAIPLLRSVLRKFRDACSGG